ncbi:MAG: class II aldolase/adducin family protein [Chloroflexota bacterium]
MTMMLEELRTSVLETALLLRKYNLVWSAGGSVCARDVKTGYIVVTPSGLDYEHLKPKDMIITDMNMTLIEGKYRPSVALNLWANFLRNRIDLNAVIHTHSPYATAFSVLGESIPVITETMADLFGQPVNVTRYLSVENPEFETAPVKVMGDGFAVLLGNHGPITVGSTLEQALERAITLEESARIYAIVRSIGIPLILSDEQSRASFDYYNKHYGQKNPRR